MKDQAKLMQAGSMFSPSSAEEGADSVRRVEPLRICTSGGPAVRDPGDVAVEEVLTIMVDGVGSFSVMCTPCDVAALAVGFAFSEGLITTADDIVQLSYKRAPHVVAMRLDDPKQAVPSRNLIVTSSCGLCGSRNIEKLLAGMIASQDALRVSGTVIRRVADEFRARQGLFAQTGGTHAAAIFSEQGDIVAFAEDIGRHSSLDKAIGRCLLGEDSLERRGVMLSGRVSLELVAKAARAGLEIITAVSAPTSLAIQAAQRCNITLCCFVRGDRATVYTHPRRIRGSEALQSYGCLNG